LAGGNTGFHYKFGDNKARVTSAVAHCRGEADHKTSWSCSWFDQHPRYLKLPVLDSLSQSLGKQDILICFAALKEGDKK